MRTEQAYQNDTTAVVVTLLATGCAALHCTAGEIYVRKCVRARLPLAAASPHGTSCHVPTLFAVQTRQACTRINGTVEYTAGVFDMWKFSGIDDFLED